MDARGNIPHRGLRSAADELGDSEDGSGEDGGCTRYHVPPGVLTVWAQKNGYAMAGENPQIEVASGSVTEVTLTLKKTN